MCTITIEALTPLDRIGSRTLRLKFNILNPINKNISEAETGGGSYIKGFMSSEFTRTLKNSDQNPSVVPLPKTIIFLTMTLT